MSADSTDVKNEILKGRPVVAGILHHGPVDAPRGGGHFIVITGFGKDYWLVQDPFGCLDLINGGWAKTGSHRRQEPAVQLQEHGSPLLLRGPL
jgi:uncharacterized protein YvpB